MQALQKTDLGATDLFRNPALQEIKGEEAGTTYMC